MNFARKTLLAALLVLAAFSASASTASAGSTTAYFKNGFCPGGSVRLYAVDTFMLADVKPKCVFATKVTLLLFKSNMTTPYFSRTYDVGIGGSFVQGIPRVKGAGYQAAVFVAFNIPGNTNHNIFMGTRTVTTYG